MRKLRWICYHYRGSIPVVMAVMGITIHIVATKCPLTVTFLPTLSML